MEYIWVYISLAAALVQTSRNGFMKHLKEKIDDEAILLSRVALSIPFVFLWLCIFKSLGYKIPSLNSDFILYISIASFAQIAGGFLFLKLFGRRNFVIGVAYTHTSTIMKMLFAAIFFGELVSLGSLFAIFISFFGVIIITLAEKHIEPLNLFRRFFTPSAIMGLSSGVFFGITGVFVRQAILSLEGEFFVSSAHALFVILIMQTLIIFIILCVKNKEQISKIFSSGSSVYLLGFTNSISSLGWFTAFSLTNAAHVSMVAQMEIIFSLFLTHKIFKEKINIFEILGMVLLLGGILLLVYSISLS
ncbi:EamA family transporter [Rickettsiales bacterium]|nr:EamA family transporter [Rickettsiales bacterium]